MVAVEVADRGPGLAPEEAAHVFEPFFRADPSRGRAGDDGEGTGLGLAIVAAIAEAHGGDVDVSTTPGGGASFVVRIPVDRLPEGPISVDPVPVRADVPQ